MHTAQWKQVNDGIILDWYESEHERGQSFQQWLNDSIEAGFLMVSEGNYYIAH